VFDEAWDTRLISTLDTVSNLRLDFKTILSTRPFGFTLSENGDAIKNLFTRKTLALRPRTGACFRDNHPIIDFDAIPTQSDLPALGYQVSAAFLFTYGAFVEAVPYDPRLYFHGEEQNLAIRAFTRGWNIWHISAPPVYHKYRVGGSDSQSVHWAANHDQGRAVTWQQLELASQRRMQALLFDGTVEGAYGLGTTRSLEDFYSISGINYQNRTIRPV
jgi:GT2 family glycosyltransferase